jgi:hypothetical protein
MKKSRDGEGVGVDYGEGHKGQLRDKALANKHPDSRLLHSFSPHHIGLTTTCWHALVQCWTSALGGAARSLDSPALRLGFGELPVNSTSG